MTQSNLLLTALCLLLWTSAAAASDHHGDLIDAGRKRFEVRCSACHGTDGTGGERAPGIGSGDRSRLQSEGQIIDIVRNGIAGTQMPAFSLPESELQQLVAFVRSRVAPADLLASSGDPKAGENFFFGQGGCAACHMIKGQGSVRGPDLTGVGARSTQKELEAALTTPDSRRTRGFAVASIQLRNGEKLEGFVKNESAFDLQLQGFDDRLHMLRSADIATIERHAHSLMPALQASAPQYGDLLAFLTRTPELTARSAPPELPGAVSAAEVVNPQPGEWPTYHGILSGNRHSALNQIGKANIAQLAPRWIYRASADHGLEVTPVVVGGVMYVTEANAVFALDPGTGREIWRFSRPRTKGLVGDAESGINRGVAVLGDRVFIVTDNAHLLALHRLNGALLWDTEMADSHEQYGATSAPLIAGGLVVSGVSGGDEGIRGFVSAYRVATGERVWRFWTIPLPGEPLASTWKGRALEHGCASTWLTGTFDPVSDLVYWTTGNPCPDFNGDERKGDNLYSSSVLALHRETGELKWYYQFTPHDLHDWDAAETPMLVDTDYGGKPRKLMLQGNRNGFFYVLDRGTGEFLGATPFVKRLTWAKEIGKDGRPVLAQGWEPTVEGTKVCPSMDGASNWMSSAYNPDTRLFYLMALEKCNVYTKSPEWWKLGESFYGGAAGMVSGEAPRKYLRALDPRTGRIVWEYPQTGPGESWGGLLSTASGLIFFCDDDGAFAAVDAAIGKPLWHFPLNEHWHASPMTYMTGGKQYVAVAAGSSIIAFGLP